MITIGIKIMPRDVILDSQGRAIESSMKSNGFQVQSLRAGKYIEMTLPAASHDLAKAEVERMLHEGGLFNPLIEKYDIYFN
ncbi:MAG: phosphoribosylformylglycinamidine synthase, purS protein [Bdellovibrionales bacterium RIFCSPHIGHO2_01_FULL_40_29]|nr:MAG: phosphoribosylformylglycinamidine synthase, purS protein [Bdellovibrionales bacterium RIFCSPHIGHO2_01_FULL_40_29]OFZ35628.1 MAG: phosphoribosylformylglycinamidine synthase, purS protein [Bdellovibrionales bacterium RIFCSPHIGHO2_02_FULL_40_15]